MSSDSSSAKPKESGASVPPGNACYTEFLTNEPEKLLAYFAAAHEELGKPKSYGPDMWGMTAPGPTDFLVRKPKDGETPRAIVHIEVASMSESVAKIKANGGELIGEPVKMEPHGQYQYFSLPGNIIAGVWEGKEPKFEAGRKRAAKDPPDEVIGGLQFFEFVSEDMEATEAFLTTVFGWTWMHTKMSAMNKAYHLGSPPKWNESDPRAPTGFGLRAIMEQSGEPAAVTAYVNTRSLEEVGTKAKEAGATVLCGKIKVPMGWFTNVMAGGVMVGAWETNHEEVNQFKKARTDSSDAGMDDAQPEEQE